MTTLSDLIARLEAAPHGTRLFDAEIFLETRVGFSQKSYYRWSGLQPKGRVAKEYNFALYAAPNFTTSLDAALTLKQSVGYTIIKFENGNGFQVELDGEMVNAKTAALGVCAAALKARETGR